MEQLFPPLSSSYILSFQFSSWYPIFRTSSIKSTIIRPLSQKFLDYLNADRVFVPKGSENVPAESTLSDDEDDVNPDEEEEEQVFAFPELDEKIRAAIKDYGAVFPKLNFSAPKDASWILPASSPLKCTSPADVYLLLKSSDFITHDRSSSSVFAGCEQTEPYELELVLRKWYSVDRSRELRCFVRKNVLIGISQRDTNYYDYLNDTTTRSKIIDTVIEVWKTKIQPGWNAEPNYVFDLLLTRDLSRAHIVDFNPYAPHTDPLLFSYEELKDLLDINAASDETVSPRSPLPELRVIHSPSHPAASSKAPANQHNMVPFEALSLSNGRDIEEFKKIWQESIKESLQPEEEE
ncbi:D123-domain-containing protein [Gymnopus androsaceus JB14]|uniref:D123-domain-containing protein n=1 Tax=Gymnopus androsaceus JB14 TaxID=1447944 RepID=A0A6A4I3N5_9AGAR|nr:D123-domain-containing protein [Gymnopus androsaceus JB14]